MTTPVSTDVLVAQMQSARQRTNSPSTEPQEIIEKEEALRQLEVEIGVVELDRLIDEGGLMSLDEAVIFALQADQGEPRALDD